MRSFPHLSCVDNVAFSLKMKGVDKTTRRKKAMQFLELVAMAQLRRACSAQLLGRPAAAHRARQGAGHQSADPLLDEPSSALDPFLWVRMRASFAGSEQLEHPLHPCHARPGRGVGARRPGRGDEQGAHRADRDAPRPVRKAGDEFIARFLGGRDVIETPLGPVAVRSDRITLRRSLNGAAQ